MGGRVSTSCLTDLFHLTGTRHVTALGLCGFLFFVWVVFVCVCVLCCVVLLLVLCVSVFVL